MPFDQLKRRQFVALLGGAAALPLAARAQQPSIPVIGFINGSSATAYAAYVQAFIRGLAETGLTVGERVGALARSSYGVGVWTRTAERQAQVAATGKTPLEIMIENARWAYDKALKLTALLSGPGAPQGEEASALMQEILKFRDAAQRYASAAAPYVHPRLAAIQHDHRSEDGSAVLPTIILTGCPGELDNSTTPAPKAGAGKGGTCH
jgi:hypothetical protein